MPKVSIIIPVFNAELYIEEAIISVLNQTEQNFEIIVINDGSLDDTGNILNKFRNNSKIQILEHQNKLNRGVSCSRMLGVRQSRSKYVAFLDADDEFRRDKLEIQLGYFENNPSCVLCHTGIAPSGLHSDKFMKDFNVSNEVFVYDYKQRPLYLRQNSICNSTTLINNKYLKGLNFQIDQLFQYEDWLLWVMLSQLGKFLFIPNKLTYYRCHDNSATSRILKKPMTEIYSKVELYINILKKPVGTKTKVLAFLYLIIQFKRLFKNYHRYL